jgi:cyclopropane fatty-acyl-phospholipid synthase-like methyltransferase
MDSAAAYEARAQAFLRGRDKSLIGSRVVEQWARGLPAGATVIELACGGGYPITQALHAAGLQLWAVDSSPTLVSAFRARFPEIPVQCARVQESDFFGRHYQGAVAIGRTFLLPEAEQSALISRVARMLAPGGRFLFTAPIEKGEWSDANTGIACRSLGQAKYEEILADAGFIVLATFSDAGANNYYDVARVA